MSDVNDGRTGGASAPSVVYTRIRKRSRAELAALPPVRTKPSQFKGDGLGSWGSWPWGEGETPRAVFDEQDPTDEATEALLDWAEISWARRHVVELVIDFTGDEGSDDELRSDDEILAIAREAGLEVVD